MTASEKRPPEHLSIERPSYWVQRFAPLIPPGEVLDLACGAGRHSRLVAGLDHPVLAVDRNAEALARAAGQGITTQQVDLETGDVASWPFADERFAGIIVTNYLFRSIFAALVRSLTPNGFLIYETFALGNARYGKPSNPDFLLATGELLEIARDHQLRVIAYEDGFVHDPKPAMVQRICAVKTELPLDGESARLT